MGMGGLGGFEKEWVEVGGLIMILIPPLNFTTTHKLPSQIPPFRHNESHLPISPLTDFHPKQHHLPSSPKTIPHTILHPK